MQPTHQAKDVHHDETEHSAGAFSPTVGYRLLRDDVEMNLKTAPTIWRRAGALFAAAALVLASCSAPDSGAGKMKPQDAATESAPQDGDPGEAEAQSPEADESQPEPEERAELGDESAPNVADIAHPAQTTTENDAGGVTVTAAGVLVGNPDAPYQVRVISDMACPFCADLAQELAPFAEEWALGDEVAVEYVTTVILDDGSGETFSAQAGNYLAVVTDRDPAIWPDAADAVYELQQHVNPSEEDIAKALAEVGVDTDEDFLAAADAREFDEWNELVTAWASQVMEIQYVPSVYLNGEMQEGADVEEIVAMINEKVAGE